VTEEGHVQHLLQVLRDLTAWLNSQKVRGAVIGGAAVSVRGRPRLTQDVDAVILLDPPNIEPFLTEGLEFGFTPRIEGAAEFAKKNRVLLLKHEPDKTPIDLSLGALPFEHESITRASIETIGGVSFPVVTAEDLIIMKAIARRPRDVADIESIVTANPELDRDRIRRWVREFAEILEMPEILTDLESLIRI
jgi:predicted nucleotidyltransferase